MFSTSVGIMTFTNNKRFGLIGIGQSWLHGNTAVARWESPELIHPHHPWDFFPWAEFGPEFVVGSTRS
jgi:hypothetical protein